jgi:DUF4097 and DUF4098 domain-containing protein YvlB
MRRSSLVGPLILIGIGVLFLLRNLYPQLPVLDFLAEYWPFVLIAWGALRLGEILFWAVRAKPLPANGISGGEWVLVIFLCLIGSGVYAARNASWFGPGRIRIGGLEVFGESFDYPVSAEKQVAKVSRVTLESFRGNARVSGVDGDLVKVTGRKTIRAMQQNDANAADQATPLEIVVNGEQVIIRPNQDRVTNRSTRVSEDFEIAIPKGVSFDAIGQYGDFDVTDIQGNVEITSDNAGVRIQNAGGNVRVDTRRSDIVRATNVKGSVDIKGGGTDVELDQVGGPVLVSGTYTGTTQFRNVAKRVRFESSYTNFSVESIPGQLRISLSDLSGSNLTGPIQLTGRTKDVQLSDFTNSLEMSLDRGDIELRPNQPTVPRMDIRTRSGDIDLALAPNAKFQITASTDSGEITNDFGSALTEQSEGRGASLRGSTGDGPKISLSSHRGSITVRQASAAEQAQQLPAPPASPKAPKAPSSLKPVEQ